MFIHNLFIILQKNVGVRGFYTNSKMVRSTFVALCDIFHIKSSNKCAAVPFVHYYTSHQQSNVPYHQLLLNLFHNGP